MSNIRIALIAEDNTDCEAVRIIVHRVLGEKTQTKGRYRKRASHRKPPAARAQAFGKCHLGAPLNF